MRIALSAKRLSVYIRVQKGISYTINLKTGSRPLSYMNNFPMEYWLNFSHVDRGKQYLIIPECEISKN
jgi:hypothetical protein